MMQLPTPKFTVVRLREGYDCAEVDAFIAKLQRDFLGSLPDPVLAERILKVAFSPRRLRPAYDMGEVDNYLDQLHYAALRGRSA